MSKYKYDPKQAEQNAAKTSQEKLDAYSEKINSCPYSHNPNNCNTKCEHRSLCDFVITKCKANKNGHCKKCALLPKCFEVRLQRRIYLHFEEIEKLSQVTPTAVKLYLYSKLFMKFNNGKGSGQHFAGNKRICEMAGISYSNVDKYTKQLVDVGLIKRLQKTKKEKGNYYSTAVTTFTHFRDNKRLKKAIESGSYKPKNKTPDPEPPEPENDQAQADHKPTKPKKQKPTKPKPQTKTIKRRKNKKPTNNKLDVSRLNPKQKKIYNGMKRKFNSHNLDPRMMEQQLKRVLIRLLNNKPL